MASYRGNQIDVNYDGSTRYYPTSITINQYQIARSYLMKKGKSQTVANTLAISLLNIAKSKRISVVKLLEDFDGGVLKLDDGDYFLLNLLGSSSNSVNGETIPTSNTDSYRYRDIRI